MLRLMKALFLLGTAALAPSADAGCDDKPKNGGGKGGGGGSYTETRRGGNTAADRARRTGNIKNKARNPKSGSGNQGDGFRW